jgi:Protein of unknown function (DUF3148)
MSDESKSDGITNGLTIGDRVQLNQRPPYLKTADSMPMLRPPDLIVPQEVGTIVDQRPGGYWVVKFERGTFLLDSAVLMKAEAHGAGDSPLLPESPLAAPIDPAGA